MVKKRTRKSTLKVPLISNSASSRKRTKRSAPKKMKNPAHNKAKHVVKKKMSKYHSKKLISKIPKKSVSKKMKRYNKNKITKKRKQIQKRKLTKKLDKILKGGTIKLFNKLNELYPQFRNPNIKLNENEGVLQVFTNMKQDNVEYKNSNQLLETFEKLNTDIKKELKKELKIVEDINRKKLFEDILLRTNIVNLSVPKGYKNYMISILSVYDKDIKTNGNLFLFISSTNNNTSNIHMFYNNKDEEKIITINKKDFGIKYIEETKLINIESGKRDGNEIITKVTKEGYKKGFRKGMYILNDGFVTNYIKQLKLNKEQKEKPPQISKASQGNIPKFELKSQTRILSGKRIEKSEISIKLIFKFKDEKEREVIKEITLNKKPGEKWESIGIGFKRNEKGETIVSKVEKGKGKDAGIEKGMILLSINDDFDATTIKYTLGVREYYHDITLLDTELEDLHTELNKFIVGLDIIPGTTTKMSLKDRTELFTKGTEYGWFSDSKNETLLEGSLEETEEFEKTAGILCHPELNDLLKEIISNTKLTHTDGKPYTVDDINKLIQRLIYNRPITFYNKTDDSPIKYPSNSSIDKFNTNNGGKYYYNKDSILIKDDGKKNASDKKEEYSIATLAALMGCWSLTPIHHSGKRKTTETDNLQREPKFNNTESYVCGLVGARFEVPGVMERAYITDIAPKEGIYKLLHNFFKTKAEYNKDKYFYNISERVPNYLIRRLYRERLRFSFELFLEQCLSVCKIKQIKMCPVFTGLGMGVWRHDFRKLAGCDDNFLYDIVEDTILSLFNEKSEYLTYLPAIRLSCIRPYDNTNSSTLPYESQDFKNKYESPYESQMCKIMTVDELDLDDYRDLPKNDVGIDALPSDVRARLKEFNRYKNILPTPHTRIILDTVGGDSASSFINANFIPDIEGNEKGYIAAQGPKDKTLGHFWRMIWQEDVRAIVMVTGLMEDSKQKCARYWPSSLKSNTGTINYGGLEVGVLSGKHQKGYKVAELEVTHPTGGSRVVKHFWFDSWPDYSVPEDTTVVPAMLEEVNEWNNKQETETPKQKQETETQQQKQETETPKPLHPWVVHCSAGIGRTGTFIGVDMGIKQLKTKCKTSVIDLVDLMRQGRGGMVQTSEQCEFIYKCLKNYVNKHIYDMIDDNTKDKWFKKDNIVDNTTKFNTGYNFVIGFDIDSRLVLLIEGITEDKNSMYEIKIVDNTFKLENEAEDTLVKLIDHYKNNEIGGLKLVTQQKPAPGGKVENNKELLDKLKVYHNHHDNKMGQSFLTKKQLNTMTGETDLTEAYLFAWDGNSFVGNEYWNKEYSNSGDPVTVSATSLGQLCNPFINTEMLERIQPQQNNELYEKIELINKMMKYMYKTTGFFNTKHIFRGAIGPKCKETLPDIFKKKGDFESITNACYVSFSQYFKNKINELEIFDLEQTYNIKDVVERNIFDSDNINNEDLNREIKKIMSKINKSKLLVLHKIFQFMVEIVYAENDFYAYGIRNMFSVNIFSDNNEGNYYRDNKDYFETCIYYIFYNQNELFKEHTNLERKEMDINTLNKNINLEDIKQQEYFYSHIKNEENVRNLFKSIVAEYKERNRYYLYYKDESDKLYKFAYESENNKEDIKYIEITKDSESGNFKFNGNEKFIKTVNEFLPYFKTKFTNREILKDPPTPASPPALQAPAPAPTPTPPPPAPPTPTPPPSAPPPAPPSPAAAPAAPRMKLTGIKPGRTSSSDLLPIEKDLINEEIPYYSFNREKAKEKLLSKKTTTNPNDEFYLLRISRGKLVFTSTLDTKFIHHPISKNNDSKYFYTYNSPSSKQIYSELKDTINDIKNDIISKYRELYNDKTFNLVEDGYGTAKAFTGNLTITTKAEHAKLGELEVINEDWYKPNLSKTQAEQVIKDDTTIVFVVTTATNEEILANNNHMYTIYIEQEANKEIKSYKIIDENGKYYISIEGQTEKILQNSVTDLISHYIDNNIDIEGIELLLSV